MLQAENRNNPPHAINAKFHPDERGLSTINHAV